MNLNKYVVPLPSEIVPNNILNITTMNKKVYLKIVNTGLSYDIVRMPGNVVLCSKPTFRLANQRLLELADEFDIMHY